MSAATLIALLTFALVSSITPGPNNMMLFASGVQFGFRRTIPHMLGVILGFLPLLLGVGFGVGAILSAFPAVFIALKIVGGLYLLHIAWKIASSRTFSDAAAGARPQSFWSAAAFQWINPKAWVMALAAITAYLDPKQYGYSILLICGAFILANIASVTCWTSFGSALRGWLSVPPRLKWFNINMGVLLALSLYPMLK